MQTVRFFESLQVNQMTPTDFIKGWIGVGGQLLNALPLQEVVKTISIKNRVKGLFEGFPSPPLCWEAGSSKLRRSTGVLRIIFQFLLGKILKYSLSQAVLPRNLLDPILFVLITLKDYIISYYY